VQVQDYFALVSGHSGDFLKVAREAGRDIGGRYECWQIGYEYKGWPAENKQKGESHEMKMGVRWSDDLCLTSIFFVSSQTSDESHRTSEEQ
jgi:hypothetical protein